MAESQREAAFHSSRPPKGLVVNAGSDMHLTWQLWLQQYQWFVIASQLESKPIEVQAATFMSAIGPDAALIYNTFDLTPEEQKNVQTLITKFDAYFAPKRNETYERYVFNKLTQQDGQSFEEYLKTIKTQVKSCEFGKLTESLLRDRIVCGVRSNSLRERLLSEENLTLDLCVKICRSTEQAAKQFSQMALTDPVVREVQLRKVTQTRRPRQTSNACTKCGLLHDAGKCPAYNRYCRSCGRMGHYAKLCRTSKNVANEKRRQPLQRAVHALDNARVDDADDSGNNVSEESFLYMASVRRLTDENLLQVNLADTWSETLTFQNSLEVMVNLDTGAQCNVLPLHIAKMTDCPVRDSPVRQLVSFSRHCLPVVGELSATCMVKERSYSLTFVVVDHPVQPVLGRKSCTDLGLIKRVETLTEHPLLVQYADIFQGLGCLANYEYDIDLKEHATFKIYPARRVPFALMPAVKQELDKMVDLGVLKPVWQPTPAVSPMVIVRKDGKLRLCIDPSEINANLLRRPYPLQTIDDIAAKIKGATCFVLLDCRRGFWQIRTSPRTASYLTVSTPWGRFSFQRLPFGVASAPEIFQAIMSDLLQNLSNVHVSMDDVLIHGTTLHELEKTTARVLEILRTAGLKLNREKCKFFVKEVKFLGHVLSEEGLKPDPEKIVAIDLLKTPTNLTELRRFLGLTNYLMKFTPGYSEVTSPLRQLLHKQTVWTWTEQHSAAVEKLKSMLRKPPVLAFYDPKKDVTLSVDASSSALGAVLLQDARPVAYATKALSQTQQAYPQIEKEALAIRFACSKFHDYIYGKTLTVETDHKPLESISKKPLHLAPPRLQRILFDILQYSPRIMYKKGTEIPVADALSRDCERQPYFDEEALEVQIVLPMSDVAVQELISATEADEELSALKTTICNGWPEDQKDSPAIIGKYWTYRDELSACGGILFKGERVIIPRTLRHAHLRKIHHGHLGIQSCLKRARETVFWPDMTNDIVNFVRRCVTCQVHQSAVPKEELLPRSPPSYPWERVASDLFHYGDTHYLLIVDAYSGFLDFVPLPTQSSRETITALKRWFAVHGIPRILQTDNGPQFASDEFRRFATEWQFTHSTSSPNYPQSNGLAERNVQTAKNILRKCMASGEDVFLALLNFRNTPRTTALGSPAQRLFGRKVRTLLPISTKQLSPQLLPDVSSHLQHLQNLQKKYADVGARTRPDMHPGDAVVVQSGHRQWKPGRILNTAGTPRSFNVQRTGGRVIRRNARHLRPSLAFSPATDPENTAQIPPRSETPISPPSPRQSPRLEMTQSPPEITDPPMIVTRFGRVVRPPQRLDL